MAGPPHGRKRNNFRLTPIGKKTNVDDLALARHTFSTLECWSVKPFPQATPIPPLPSFRCTGELLALTLPGRCRRLTELDFKGQAAPTTATPSDNSAPTEYGENLIGTDNDTNSYLLWLINDKAQEEALDAEDISSDTIYDFCEPDILATGQGEPCVQGIDTLAVEWQYDSFISALGEKGGLLAATRNEFPANSVKMMATAAPNHSIIWIPIIDEKEAKDIYDLVASKTIFTAYGVTYLDGPNIFVGRVKNEAWFKYRPR